MVHPAPAKVVAWSTAINKREINPFEEEYNIPRDDRYDKLDLEYDALALLVESTKEASISLIAARFEYDLRDYERRQLRSGRV